MTGGQVWASPDTAWTVAFDRRDPPPAPVPGRFLWLRQFADFDDLRLRLGGWGDHLATIGVSGWKARDTELTSIVVGSGATRVCPLATMQDPPLDRFHDGRAELADLLTIRDWELA
jgi:hypothetical protein